jgi:uncharacterized OB-fold protein
MKWNPILPAQNSDTELWWDATRSRRLILQRCKGCDHIQHYPRALCLACGNSDLAWKNSTGTGVLYSASTVLRSPDPHRFETPYVVALVQLSEGPMLFTRLISNDAYKLDIPVTIDWQPLEDGRHLPVFRPRP